MTTLQPTPDHPCHDDEPVSRSLTVEVTEYTVSAVSELLAMVDEFFRTAGPAVIAELRGYLRDTHPSADPCWLIDMIGFNSMHLRRLLPPAAAHPRENWHDPLPEITSGPNSPATKEVAR